MILPRIICPDKINLVCENLPPDVPTSKYVEHDLEAYYNAPKVIYKFNSRGFRDEEWPSDLSNCVWVVGDSGSLGMGLPYECTWPYLLEKELNVRVMKICKINSNNDIDIFGWSRDIIENIKPKVIYVQWSYLWRNSTNKFFTLNPSKKDADLTLSLMEKLDSIRGKTRVINMITPVMHWDTYFLNLVNNSKIDKAYGEDVDLSRDMIHLGVESHKGIAQTMANYLYEKNIEYK